MERSNRVLVLFCSALHLLMILLYKNANIFSYMLVHFNYFPFINRDFHVYLIINQMPKSKEERTFSDSMPAQNVTL